MNESKGEMEMGEELIFHHVKTTRDITLNAFEKISDTYFLDIPEGFNNHIFWNFGHIAYVQEMLVFGLVGKEMNVPEEFKMFFARGTKPAEWVDAPPTFKEVKEKLKEQTSRIETEWKGKLDTPLLEPFSNSTGKTFYTVGETLLFSTYHEALHFNTILRLYRCLKTSQRV